MNKVIIDTSIWIDYFRNKEDVVAEVDMLLDANAAIITGPVIAELLQGLKTDRERKLLISCIGAVPYEGCMAEDWYNAGNLGFSLKRTGKTVPLTDLLIASVAGRCSFSVYSLDGHFALIQEIALYKPQSL